MRLGIDLGGTKIEAVLLDQTGAVLVRQRVSTPQSGYQDTLDAISGLVESVEQDAGQRTKMAGIGTPGSLSPQTGLIRNANSTRLNGQPLDRDLARVLDRPVRIANDANCFALAETRSGAARGASTVFGVIAGTGVGGGIVIGGRTILGRNRISGEWGHNPLPSPHPEESPGPACYCGKSGCIETWCSGPGMMHDHERQTGLRQTPAKIAAAASEGDRAAQVTLERHTDRLARALAGMVNILDPDIIVLGGGLSNLDHLAPNLPDAMRPWVFSDCFETPIVRNQLGDSAGVIGAAWLWEEGETA